MVHPVLHPSDLCRRYQVKIRAFGEEAADHTVVILHAALFPGGIAVTVVDGKAIPFTPAALDKLVVLHKLAAVVGGDAAEFLAEAWCLSFQLVYGPSDRFRLPIRQLHNDLLSAPALC